MSELYDAAVIGAGHNGLVTAAYLAKAGLRVVVLERRDLVGGAAVSEEVFPGFRVDTGAHSVGSFHPAVLKDLKLDRHGLEIITADPTALALLPDGDHLLLWREAKKTMESIGRFSEIDADRWVAFSEQVRRAAGFIEAVNQTRPPRLADASPAELGTLMRLGGRLRRLGKKAMAEVLRTLPMSVAEFLDEWFESDALKGTLGAAGVTGLFQGPLAAGTAFPFLSHHAGDGGGGGGGGGGSVIKPTRLVKGGMGALSGALADAAREAGAEIRTSAAVGRVHVKDGEAVGVVLESGEEIAAKRIISNADPRRTLLQLVEPLCLDPEFVRKVRSIKFRGSCAKVHLALGELPNFAGLNGEGSRLRGTISVAPSLDYLERAYDDAKYGGVSEEPYLEAVISSLSDPTSAPDGKHVMSVLVQYAPYHLKEGSWDDAKREQLGDRAVEVLARYAPNLPAAIIDRHVLTPLDLERVYGLTEGNIYHGEHTLDQLYFMRPVPGWARYRTPIAKLYLCGAGTHPGGGVTGAPGYNAAREILKDVKRNS